MTPLRIMFSRRIDYATCSRGNSSPCGDSVFGTSRMTDAEMSSGEASLSRILFAFGDAHPSQMNFPEPSSTSRHGSPQVNIWQNTHSNRLPSV